MCAVAPTQEELSFLMVGLVGLGKAEWILLTIILSLPIIWNTGKLPLVNPAKFHAQMLQMVPSKMWGPHPALQMKYIDTHCNSDPESWLRLAAGLVT